MIHHNNFSEIRDHLIQEERVYNNLETFNKEINHNNNLILYLNIRSLNANFEKLLILIESLKIKPYIIVCTEVWNLSHYEYFSIKEYKMYYNFGKINKNDGVVIYIKEEVKHITEIIEIERLKILNTKVDLNNNKQLEITSLYRSHDLSTTEFNLNLKSYLYKKRNIKNHIIIGDFNINIKDQTIISNEFLNNFLENGFLPSFTKTTRPINSYSEEGSCIDNIFIKTDFIKTKALTLKATITDHYPLFLELKIRNIISKNNDKIIESYSYNYTKLTNAAKEINWNKYKSGNDPNLIINSMIEEIQSCLEKAKICNTKNTQKATPRNAWITKAIINSCNTKEKLYSKVKQNPNNQKIKDEYKKYCKQLDKVIKAAKIEYDRSIIEKNRNDPRKLWDCINKKLNKNKNKSNNTITEIKNESNEILKNENDIANAMNEYFCKLGKRLSDRITTPRGKEIEIPKSNPKTLFIKPTNKFEIMKIIDNLKLKKGGVDKISAKTLKATSTVIADTLAYVFNLCIEKSIWPDALKTAEVIPIYKSGNKKEMSNYRPISLISNIAKIFEKIIHNRIIEFLNKNNIITKKQFGFIKNMGTRDALSLITKIIYEKLDQSKPIAITFLDLAKAFDTVNHKILLDKLYAYGIRGKGHKLIKSYLSNRKQTVRIGTQNSKPEIIDTGVPQGTILGPLFFILYVNDLLTSMPEEAILSYADDTAVVATGKTWTEVENKMNNYLNLISIWLRLNKLTLNIQKTVYITFGSYCDSVPKDFDIKINNESIERVLSTKYLGIIIDMNMKWDKHIQYLINKTRYLIFIFNKLRKYMDICTLKIIYYALFHSVISYGIIAWGGAYQREIQLLQAIQNRIIKIINKNTFPSITPLNLKQLFEYESLRFFYNHIKEEYTNSNSRTRRKLVLPPKYNKRISTKNSYITAINMYNGLPNELKTLNLKNSRNNKKIKDWLTI